MLMVLADCIVSLLRLNLCPGALGQIQNDSTVVIPLPLAIFNEPINHMRGDAPLLCSNRSVAFSDLRLFAGSHFFLLSV